MLFSQHALVHDTRHVTPWCNTKHYTSIDIIPFTSLNLVTNENIESCSATESCPVTLASKANSPFLLPLRSLQHLPGLYKGTAEITEESMLLFLVLACPIPGGGGRLGPKCLAWIAMPFTRCDVPAPERVSSSLSMLSHASVVLTSGLNIFRQTNLVIRR